MNLGLFVLLTGSAVQIRPGSYFSVQISRSVNKKLVSIDTCFDQHEQSPIDMDCMIFILSKMLFN